MHSFFYQEPGLQEDLIKFVVSADQSCHCSFLWSALECQMNYGE